MRRLGVLPILLAGLLLPAAEIPAQVLLDLKNINVGVGEEIPSGFTGVGARAMGMGGAHVAAANDGSALFWNPAALTRIRRVELLGALGHLRPRSSADLGLPAPRTATAGATATRLNAAIFTAPYPTYRGGMSFAIGVARPVDYGYHSLREGVEWLTSAAGGAAEPYAVADEITVEGSLPQYAMGLAVEVSPTVSLGMSVVWHRGDSDVRREVTLVEQTDAPLPDSLVGLYRQRTDIRGVGVSLGTTVRLPLGISMGAVALPPVKYSLKGKWGDSYDEAIGESVYYFDYQERPLEYRITSPWQIGLGLSWASYAFTLAADAWYTDWSQGRYGGDPYGGAAGINTHRYFVDRYRQTFRWHIGGEALVPFIRTYLRAGYYHDPDPFRGPAPGTRHGVAYVNSGNYYTLGAGWLVDEVLTADVTLIFGGDKYSAGALTEERTARRALFTVAFRL